MNWSSAANEVLKWGVVIVPLAYFGYKAVTGLIEDWPHAKKRNATVPETKKKTTEIAQSLFLQLFMALQEEMLWILHLPLKKLGSGRDWPQLLGPSQVVWFSKLIWDDHKERKDVQKIDPFRNIKNKFTKSAT